MKAEINGKTVRLPDFLIVGAGKSGTTSLFRYLDQHPRIFIPELKEPHFFSYSGEPTYYKHYNVSPVIWDFDEYTALFDPADDDQLLGEASPTYLFFYDKTIRNIKKYVPDWKSLKIIIILRHPIDRTLSQYRMNRMKGREPLKLKDAIKPFTIQQRMNDHWAPGFDYTGYSLYYERVKAYMDNFPHVKVCLYEDLRKDALSLMKSMYRFLEVDDSFVPDVSMVHNPSGDLRSYAVNKLLRTPDIVSSRFPFVKYLMPLNMRVWIIDRLKSLNIAGKKDMVEKKTLLHLKGFYAEDINKLQGLIGRDLSFWIG